VNLKELARRDLERAGLIFQEARSYKDRGIWNMAVRRAQEAVELALKASLRWAGLDVPRVHDVGPTLKQHTARFPDQFSKLIPKLAEISRALRLERETSFYGDEASGVAAEELYVAEDAEKALEKAEFVLRACEVLFARRG